MVDGSERPNAVLLNAEAMTNLDISGLATLHEVQQILKAQGVHLSLARVTGQTLDLLQRSSMLGEIKPPLVFSSVRSGSVLIATGCASRKTRRPGRGYKRKCLTMPCSSRPSSASCSLDEAVDCMAWAD